MSVQLSAPAGLPAGFRRAVTGLSGVELRPELVVNELPAPQRLAPYAVALHAAVIRAGDELADGRLVVGATQERAEFAARPTAGGVCALLRMAQDLVQQRHGIKPLAVNRSRLAMLESNLEIFTA